MRASVLPLDQVPESPVTPWREFIPWFWGTWKQGEHVTIIGPTDSGKTTLAEQILRVRRYLTAFCVKGRDDSMDRIIRRLGLWRMEEFTPDVADRIALWPKIRGAGHRDRQVEVFTDAIDTIYRMGGWCAFFDEMSYIADTLHMTEWVKFLIQQGRSSHISVVSLTQRPAFIPLACYDQANHLFVAGDNDHRNIHRIAELTGTAYNRVSAEIPLLEKHQWLYINRDTKYRVKTTVEV